MSTPKTSLFDLPYELRQRIFAYAVKREGTIELQYPLWAMYEPFLHPLFAVCHQVRDEALQAFYETNSFLWIVDTDSATNRSDPASYASMREGLDGNDTEASGVEQHSGLTRGIPWTYPHLKKHLRHLHVNIYLPSNLIGDVKAATAWHEQLPRALEGFVMALDRGRRLSSLVVLFTTRHMNSRIPLAGEQLKALEMLTEMEIRGHVRVMTRWDFKDVKTSILSLDLEKRMRA